MRLSQSDSPPTGFFTNEKIIDFALVFALIELYCTTTFVQTLVMSLHLNRQNIRHMRLSVPALQRLILGLTIGTCVAVSIPVLLAQSGGRCGDGVLQGNEQCDDGNMRSYDGCSIACKRDSTDGSAKQTFTGNCTSSYQCGPGMRCSTELGDCQSACAPGAEICMQVCAGHCIPTQSSSAGSGVNSCRNQQQQFRAVVEANKQCSQDSECAIFEKSCPLVTCGEAVRRDALSLVNTAANEQLAACNKPGDPVACAGCLPQQARCVSGRCTTGSGQSSSNDRCKPYICRDGSQHPSCTREGHPINYFVDPCFQNSQQTCGNNMCETGEADRSNCPACIHNNPACLTPCEFIRGSCPQDCTRSQCGDGMCKNGESAYACDPAAGYPNTCQGHIYCPQDCAAQQQSSTRVSYLPNCGDGICQNVTCTAIGCPQPETKFNCPADCRSGHASSRSSGSNYTCGNNRCEADESMWCPRDCQGTNSSQTLVVAANCGNNRCEGDEYWWCPKDCFADPVLTPSTSPTQTYSCGNNRCDGDERIWCPRDCFADPVLTPSTSPTQTYSCGNNRCDGDERIWCPRDCYADPYLTNPSSSVSQTYSCGNNRCEGDERMWCPKDCYADPYLTTPSTSPTQTYSCGNNRCDGDERMWCPKDCYADPYLTPSPNTPAPLPGLAQCGNNRCEADEYWWCPRDCPTMNSTNPTTPGPSCGNRICEGNETRENCGRDCEPGMMYIF